VTGTISQEAVGEDISERHSVLVNLCTREDLRNPVSSEEHISVQMRFHLCTVAISGSVDLTQGGGCLVVSYRSCSNHSGTVGRCYRACLVISPFDEQGRSYD
jgi:hypothetical protein